MVKTTRLNAEGLSVYPVWSGDGTTPPPFQGNTFSSTHDHMNTTGANTVDSGDLDALTEHVTHHGYGADAGQQLICFVNPAQGRAVRTWRAGQANSNGAIASADFIPSEGAPSYLLTNATIVGDLPAAQFGGQKIIGSYGSCLIAESGYFPQGYMAVVASGGPGSSLNPIGFREHPNSSYRGLRLIPGMRVGYPLLDSFYSRGFGTGVRHRGGAAVCQITTAAAYTSPSFA